MKKKVYCRYCKYRLYPESGSCYYKASSNTDYLGNVRKTPKFYMSIKNENLDCKDYKFWLPRFVFYEFHLVFAATGVISMIFLFFYFYKNL